MSLEIGTKLTHYEIVEPIGKGGMGEVYRAKDSKLGRDVAIKVLPDEFAENEERLARFKREANVLAALNHPGIAAIHGLEESDGRHYLVLELVPGETLAERIARGRIPVEEALDIATKISEALEEAHEQGIVHRDLKPANIKLTPDDKVKVLDFGLAKAFVDEVPEADSSMSPTITRDATRMGVILGTAAYMSPDQARGKKVDKRTDVFAFGAVLFEMLTGTRAFPGDDAQEVLANVINREPDWNALPPDAPLSVVKLLRRCLTKDRRERLQAIGEARIAARHYRDETDVADARSPTLAWAVAAVFAALFLMMVWRPWRSELPPETSVRLSVDVGVAIGEGGQIVALSPDGKTLVHPVRGEDDRLHIRTLDTWEARPLVGTEGAIAPFFSPDGQWLAFFAGGALKKVSVSGGAAVTITEAETTLGGAWGPDNTIVYSQIGTGLRRVAASGGSPVELTTLGEGVIAHRWPWFLPNGRAVLFSAAVAGADPDGGTIEAVFLESGERKVVQPAGTYPHYVTSGHLLYAQEDTLFAMPFDADRIESTGEASPVIHGVRLSAFGQAHYAVGRDGTLVYAPRVAQSGAKLVWVDREGNASVLMETIGDYESPRLSADGEHLVVRKVGERGQQDVWLLELSRGTMTRLTFDEGLRPLLSPDGATVFFSSARNGRYNIFSKPADGSGPAKLVTDGPFRVPSDITSDGKTLIFRQGGDAGFPDLNIGMMRLDGVEEPEMLLQSTFAEHTPKLSPDDRWLAYVSNETGREEIYVTPFPRGGKLQISTEGGKEPTWSRDGRELFYRNGEKMMAVAIAAGTELSPGKPTLLFEEPYDLKIGSGASNYDVAEDGRFVMVHTEMQSTHLNFVLNWFDELNRLVPTDP